MPTTRKLVDCVLDSSWDYDEVAVDLGRYDFESRYRAVLAIVQGTCGASAPRPYAGRGRPGPLPTTPRLRVIARRSPTSPPIVVR